MTTIKIKKRIVRLYIQNISITRYCKHSSFNYFRHKLIKTILNSTRLLHVKIHYSSLDNMTLFYSTNVIFGTLILFIVIERSSLKKLILIGRPFNYSYVPNKLTTIVMDNILVMHLQFVLIHVDDETVSKSVWIMYKCGCLRHKYNQI